MPVDLSQAVIAPPRATRTGTSPAKRESAKLTERREAAEGIFQLAGFGCIIMRQYADAGAIGMHSGPIVNELVTLSEKNEGIAKVLDYLTEAGPYAGLIVAIMPLALQIAANHKVIKAELTAGAGVVPPEALESQVRADMARQAAEALRAQQAAEAELRELSAQMAPQNPPETPSGPNGHDPASSGRGRKPARSESP